MSDRRYLMIMSVLFLIAGQTNSSSAVAPGFFVLAILFGIGALFVKEQS